MSDNDADELVDDHRVYYRVKKKCFPITVLVCILLLVGCIVLAVLYSQSVNKKTSPTVVQKPRKKYEICNEDRCFELGKEIVHSLNESVNPCDDFYAYACGGWQKRNPLQSGAQSSTVTGVLRKNSYDTLKRALEQASRNYSKNVAVMKTARFYKFCMNTTAIESVGVQPLLDLVAEYGGWSVFNNSNTSVSIETRIARATRELNVDSLLPISPITDAYNSSNTILLIKYAVVTYPTSLYLNKSEKVRNQIKENIQVFAKAFGINGTETIAAKLMAIYDFEAKLAKTISGKTPEEELSESFKKSIQERREIPDYRLKIKDVCVKSGFSCPLLKKILKMTYGRSFSGEELVLVTNITYFKNLHKLYQDTLSAGNGQIIVDYVMWRVVFKYLNALSLNASSVTPSSRSSYCINTQMMSAFDMTLGLMYVDAKFDYRSKKTVEEMTNDLRQSFIERLQQQTWMDPETQKKAKEKAQAIRVSIGYPLYIKDSKKLEEHYKSFDVTDDFFANFRAMNHFLRMREINAYGKPVDKNAWIDGKSPASVNGFYNSKTNAITYLAGILQPPFYNPEYPSYMQYGAIGMVIGHELTHGFDSSGRLFDKDGNLRDWWSSSADANFKEKAQCLVDQYGKYTFHGMKIDGTLTINENIADNGGIKVAYDAYQRWAAKNGTEKILPGLNLTPDQLFFVGFAQGWCGVFTKKGALAQLRDVHSPGKYRVIGSLSNNKKFSEVFKCPVGSPMNPNNKCSVW